MTTSPATPTTPTAARPARRRTGSLRHPVTARASSDLLTRPTR